MTLRFKALAGAIAFMMVATAVAEAATSAQINRQFRNAVSQVLNNVRSQQPALADMSNSEFRAFVSCAQNVMNDAPLADKQYVLAGRSLSEKRRRFDEIASRLPLDRGSTLKSKITQQCYL